MLPLSSSLIIFLPESNIKFDFRINNSKEKKEKRKVKKNNKAVRYFKYETNLQMVEKETFRLLSVQTSYDF